MAWRKINDTILTAIADAIRNRLSTSDKMSPDDMPSLIGDIGVGVIPAYWRSYLDSKTTEINSALSAAGDNKSAFLWYTDTHWVMNYGQSPMMLKILSRDTGMQKTFFGGDVANAASGEIDMLTAWQGLVKDIPNHHSLIGNHDYHVSELADDNAKADFFLMPERTGDVVFGTNAVRGKCYYYVDNHIENTRYICLSTGRMYTWSDEVEWFIDVLNSTPKDWHIVVLSHIWLDSTSGVIDTTPPNYTQVFLNLCDAYNYRESGASSMHSKTYDFTAAQAKVEFIIGGHLHRDYDFTTAKGIPVILTECDNYGDIRDSTSSALKGTTTENCIFAIVADYDAKMVKVINVGRGHTHSIAIPGAETYTNWLTKVVNTDGTISDGQNYKENTRMNSSGTETTESGWYATGLIPAVPGDVIRLKNCYFPKTYTAGTNRSAVHPYDASGVFGGNYTSASGLPDLTNAYDTDEINIIQITIPTWMKCTYVRLTLKTINSDSIITVNEEIE